MYIDADLIKAFIYYFLFFFPVFAGAVFFYNFRNNFITSGILYSENIIQSLPNRPWQIFLQGFFNTLRLSSVHSLFSSYFSLLVSGHYEPKYLLRLFLGAEFAVFFSAISLYWFFAFEQSIILIYIFVLLTLISLIFINKKKWFLSLFFFSLFLFSTYVYTYPLFDNFKVLSVESYYYFIIPFVSYLVFSSTFIFLYFFIAMLLPLGLMGQFDQILPFLIILAFLLFTVKMYFRSPLKTSKVSLLLSAVSLSLFFQALLYWLFSVYLTPYPSFFLALIVNLFLSHYIINFLNHIIKKRKYKEPNILKWHQLGHKNSVPLEIDILVSEIRKKAALVFSMLQELYQDLKDNNYDAAHEKKLQKYEKITDNMQSEIILFSEHLMREGMDLSLSSKLRAIIRISDELESLADTSITLYKYLSEDPTILKNTEYRDKILLSYSKNLLFYEKVFEDLREKAFFVENEDVFKRSLKISQNLSEFKTDILNNAQSGGLESEEVLRLMDWYYQIKKIKSCTANIYQAFQGIR